jgi:ribosome-associated heat shock protein Hsp15
MRLDKWLWQARLSKSRTLAQKWIEAGAVRVNRVAAAKTSALVKPGDVLTFAQGPVIRVVRILAFGHRRGPPAEARALYEDLG